MSLFLSCSKYCCDWLWNRH